MTVRTTTIEVSTQGDGDAIDITAELQRAVAAAEIAEGQASAFVRGSTAAITTMEYEPGGVQDLGSMLERLIPSRGDYEHNRLNHDTNSHAHQRASVIGPSLIMPVIEGRLDLGTWQQVVLLDFDDRPRQRTVTIQVVG
jgi:secondary thiamine-phosphate synthase enzyme